MIRKGMVFKYAAFKLTMLGMFFLTMFMSSCNSPKKQIEVSIIHINDVYEIAPVNMGKEGGYARLAYLVDSFKQQNPNTILVHAGDFLSPSLIGNLKDDGGNKIKGKHMVEVMNSVGIDYVTFGNHEFDIKETELLQRLSESTSNWISANVYHRMDSITTQEFQYKGQAIPKLIKIPFILNPDTFWLGITSITLPFNKRPYVYYDDFENSLSQVLDSSSATKVVLLSHLEREQDASIAKKFPDIPLIMGGHDHYHFMDTFKTNVVAKADANLRTIWKHNLIYDFDTKALSINSELIPITSDIPEKPEVKKVVDKWLQFAEQTANTAGFNVNEVIWQGDSLWECRETIIRKRQTNFGCVVAQAMVWATQSDIALLNSGSLRYDDQIKSSLTQQDVLKALPFGGNVVVTNMTGEDVLEYIKTSENRNKGTGGYLQLASSLELRASLNNLSFDTEGEYKVVTSSFMASGRENNFQSLKDHSWQIPKLITDTSKNDIRHLVIEYFKQTN
jgi:2',3'-cyclic-nucleotide 2'-phosphodiesterase (5'-nucleotidase family)